MRILLFLLSFIFANASADVDQDLVLAVNNQQQVIQNLQQEVLQLKQYNQAIKQQNSTSPLLHIPFVVEQNLGSWPSMSQITILFFAVLILWAMFEFGDVKLIERSTDDYDNEYDFLNTQEGLESQLDLAQAYIEMGDLQSAKLALNIVIASDNKPLIEQANNFLLDIKKQEG